MLSHPGHYRVRFRRRMVFAVWRGLPAVSVLLLMLPQVLPRHAGAMTDIFPPLALLAMFYWCMERPERFTYGWSLAAGFLQDIITATPIGLNAMLWVLARYLLVKGRKDVKDQGFLMMWLYASLLLLIVLMGQWMALSFSASLIYPLSPVIVQWVQGALCYPALHAVLHAIERRFFRKYWYLLKPT